MSKIFSSVLFFLVLVTLSSSSSSFFVSAYSECDVTLTAVTGDCVPTTLYDSEWIDPVVFNLYQPVTTDLTVTFSEGTGRVVMNPSTINLAAGATSFASRLDVNYLSTDTRVFLKPNFVVTFTGSDTGLYVGAHAFNLTLQPKIFCQLFAPQYAFYPGTTDYGLFNISCGRTQDSTVSFVPPNLTAQGITFTPETGVTLTPGVLWGTFSASAVQGYLPVGNYPLNFTNTGDNATRYRDIQIFTMRVRSPAKITLPPSFSHVSFRDSEEFHVDITLIPRGVVYLRIDAFYAVDGTNASDVIEIRPSNILVYNRSTRGTFKVYAKKFDQYYLNFSITGDEAVNFQSPLTSTGVPFTINSPEDGFAFNKRATVGYLSRIRGCRVGVGRRSYKIAGQDPVDENVCVHFPIDKNHSESDYNCSRWITPERCQGVVQERGVPCAWLFESQECVDVPELRNNISQVVFGSSATAFLDRNGTVYTIGRALYGQLGVYRAPANQLIHVAIPEAIKVLAAGANHFLAVGGSGTMYSWGSNFRGQLGLNTEEPSMPTPKVVAFPRLENVSCICAGLEHSAAITTAGRAYVWGFNHRGQAAQDFSSFTTSNPVEEVRRPILLPAAKLNNDAPVAVNCGETHTVIATEFNAYTFGGNTHGQLGRLGVDEFEPDTPVIWDSSQPVGTAPTYPSYTLGKDCP